MLCLDFFGFCNLDWREQVGWEAALGVLVPHCPTSGPQSMECTLSPLVDKGVKRGLWCCPRLWSNYCSVRLQSPKDIRVEPSQPLHKELVSGGPRPRAPPAQYGQGGHQTSPLSSCDR